MTGTLEKWLSPSLTRGVVGNMRWGLMTKEPWSRLYRLLITSIKSDVFFTGRNRLLGTFIPGILLYISTSRVLKLVYDIYHDCYYLQ